ncbi:hypothetical protein D3C78_1080320 [compost metagenome]
MKPLDINSTPKKNRRSRLTFSELGRRLAIRAPINLPQAHTANIRPNVVLADSGVNNLETIGKPTLCAALPRVSAMDSTNIAATTGVRRKPSRKTAHSPLLRSGCTRTSGTGKRNGNTNSAASR